MACSCRCRVCGAPVNGSASVKSLRERKRVAAAWAAPYTLGTASRLTFERRHTTREGASEERGDSHATNDMTEAKRIVVLSEDDVCDRVRARARHSLNPMTPRHPSPLTSGMTGAVRTLSCTLCSTSSPTPADQASGGSVGHRLGKAWSSDRGTTEGNSAY